MLTATHKQHDRFMIKNPDEAAKATMAYGWKALLLHTSKLCGIYANESDTTALQDHHALHKKVRGCRVHLDIRSQYSKTGDFILSRCKNEIQRIKETVVGNVRMALVTPTS